MSNPTETTNAFHARRTLALETVEDRNMDLPMPATMFDEVAVVPAVSWDDGSATIVVEGGREELVEFFKAALKLARTLPKGA